MLLRFISILIIITLPRFAYCLTEVVDGITWTYTVSNGAATVGGGSSSSPAIATSTSGAITVPTTLGGVPVTGIAKYAFYNCANITSAVIQSGVASIGERAFMGCSRLTRVNVPSTVKTMGTKAFRDCSNLQGVYIESLRAWCEIVFDSPAANPLCYAHSLYINDVLVKHLTIPDGVTTINACAFRNDNGGSVLEAIDIPDSVTTVGGAAFGGCSSLKSVSLPQAVCSTGFSEAFPDSVTSVTNIDISPFATNICDSAFAGCSGLTSIVIPDSVRSIGNNAFDGCSSLVDVTIPQCVCSARMSTIFPSAFQSITNVVISDSVTRIGDSAFESWIGLASIVIPEGVTNIDNSAFRDCIGLVSLIVPDSVVSIGQYAFQGCNGLSEVDIPASVRIGYKAFDGCPAEENITYTDVAPQIRNVTAKQRFPWNGKVDITFEVVGDVAVGLQEWNMPCISVSALNRVTGVRYEASRAALFGDTGTAEGMHHVVWDLNVQGQQIKSDDVVFNIAYKTMFDVQGIFCVIDLSDGANASSYPVSYLADVPSGGWTDEHKTTKLVLRLIEPGSFKMGGSYNVTLTKPYYCGLFEVTQRQWELVTGSNPCSSTTYGKGDNYPVHYVSYDMIRGSSAGAGWPASYEVDASSFFGKLRARTGLDFDLPTEAQWEYACRAGTTTTYYWGNSMDGNYAWYTSNSSSKTHPVGTKTPNVWGLYDMSGNVCEWCRDWYGGLASGVADPKGCSSGLDRVLRGGSYYDLDYCTSSYRCSSGPSIRSSSRGFRLIITMSE